MAQDSERADVVVIGAGLGGLSAAGYLAKQGRKVIVLEHHAVPGGYAHEFRRGKFRFEVALHAMDGVRPGGWVYPILEHLGVIDQVRFHRLDPFYTVKFPDREVTAPADIDAYKAELVRHFPSEAEGIDAIFSAMLAAAKEVSGYVRANEEGNRVPTEEIPARFPNMVAVMTQTWADYMGQFIKNPELQGVLSVLWGYYGLPAGRLCAGTFVLGWVSYHLNGAYYPEGRSQAISRAIEKTILSHGGEVRYRQTVENIEMRDDLAVAVTTNKAMRIEADLIISNASPSDTMLKFVGAQHLPADYVEKLGRDPAALSNLVVYLGLDRDLAAEGWPHHEFFLCDDYSTEVGYRITIDGQFDKAPMVLTHYTPVDPSCAPKGSSVLVVMCLAPWNYENQWGTAGELTGYRKNERYQALKKAAGDHLVRRIEPYIPGLRDSIKHMEIATPLTNHRYSLNPAGSIYGSDQTVGNSFRNRVGSKTPIRNLLLTGAWVAGGGMSTALISGRNTARIATSLLNK